MLDPAGWRQQQPRPRAAARRAAAARHPEVDISIIITIILITIILITIIIKIILITIIITIITREHAGAVSRVYREVADTLVAALRKESMRVSRLGKAHNI